MFIIQPYEYNYSDKDIKKDGTLIRPWYFMIKLFSNIKIKKSDNIVSSKDQLINYLKVAGVRLIKKLKQEGMTTVYCPVNLKMELGPEYYEFKLKVTKSPTMKPTEFGYCYTCESPIDKFPSYTLLDKAIKLKISHLKSKIHQELSHKIVFNELKLNHVITEVKYYNFRKEYTSSKIKQNMIYQIFLLGVLIIKVKNKMKEKINLISENPLVELKKTNPKLYQFERKNDVIRVGDNIINIPRSKFKQFDLSKVPWDYKVVSDDENWKLGENKFEFSNNFVKRTRFPNKAVIIYPLFFGNHERFFERVEHNGVKFIIMNNRPNSISLFWNLKRYEKFSLNHDKIFSNCWNPNWIDMGDHMINQKNEIIYVK